MQFSFKLYIILSDTFSLKSPDNGLTDRAIYFRSNSSNTTVDHNFIVNCDCEIGFWLANNKASKGGVIRNSMNCTNRDIDFKFENSEIKIYNNTLFTENYFNSNEYKFDKSSATIINNLCSKEITKRSYGKAYLSNNYISTISSLFKNYKEGNLHLVIKSEDIANKELSLEDVKYGIDGEKRSIGSTREIEVNEVF